MAGAFAPASLAVAARLVAALLPCSVHAEARSAWNFSFGSAAAAPATADAGVTRVLTATPYDDATGYGFEPGATLTAHARSLASDAPFYFSAAVPEGNYRVTVTFGGSDAAAPTSTTVKAELRRLLVECIDTAAGEVATRTFTVNVRTPHIPAFDSKPAGEVKLKAPRETTQEAWAWDRRLTLEFNGAHPALSSLEITPAPADTPTLFILGDSTVCDQSREPYNSWGQMLPRWFKPGVALANHGESGETYRDSLARRRVDKILSVMRPGDTLLLQFGHNDQKQIAAATGGPFTTYKAEIKTVVDAVRARGGIPVIVSPMERRDFDPAGKIIPSLTDYADAARQSATELGVAFIDLHAMSVRLYEALGPERSKVAFVSPEPGKIDNTHHTPYGSYELAKCTVLGLRRAHLAIADFIVDDFPTFDPAHPDAPESFAIPPSPLVATQRPLGDDTVR